MVQLEFRFRGYRRILFGSERTVRAVRPPVQNDTDGPVADPVPFRVGTPSSGCFYLVAAGAAPYALRIHHAQPRGNRHAVPSESREAIDAPPSEAEINHGVPLF